MQIPKRHIPVVGILGIIVIAAAGGGIYYYQFVVPHNTSVVAPVHRLIFMTAIVEEEGGFHVTNTAVLNQTSMPAFTQTNGPNMTGVTSVNYEGNSDNKTISAHVGDTLTFYIKGMNATSPCGSYSDGGVKECWLSPCNAHGFSISGSVQVINGTLGGQCGSPSSAYIPFGKWYSVTVKFTAPGTYSYFCFIVCSLEHANMIGSIAVT